MRLMTIMATGQLAGSMLYTATSSDPPVQYPENHAAVLLQDQKLFGWLKGLYPGWQYMRVCRSSWLFSSTVDSSYLSVKLMKSSRL